MASHATSLFSIFSIIAIILASSANAQLTPNFYARTCPNVQTTVRNAMAQAVRREARMGASILRLFFHDCFVNGCDASILLDDTATFTGEKTARPNQNSIRGFEVIDTIKSRVEAACNATVSCADILALAARDGVVLLGGPSWTVPLGRRDARTASLNDANNGQIPSSLTDLATLISTFSAKGLNARDMTALSGGHVIGLARCTTFRNRIYNDTNIDSTFATTRRANCPASGGDNNLAPLDQTPNQFDNSYYRNLVLRRGLLHTDQELFNNGSQDALVRTYSNNYRAFASDFAAAMVKMSNISPLTGTQGEIRSNCRVVN